MKTQTRREFLKVTLSAAASAGALSLIPRAALAAEGTAEKPGKRPNILFFFPDQHRFDWLGTNPGLKVRTPNLDRLMARGVRFAQAFTPSPLCAPARACLEAGKEYDRCGVAGNNHDYPVDQTTFYSILRDSGYHVMGCGKFDLHKATPDWGTDGKRLLNEWGFSDGIDNAGKNDAIAAAKDNCKEPYTAYLRDKGLLDDHQADYKRRRQEGKAAAFPTTLPEDAYCDNWLAERGLELIRRAPKGKPWFLQINFTGPHSPWDITKKMDALYRDVDFPQPNRCRELTRAEHVAIRRNYSAMVTNIDRWLGVYLDELRQRGELDNTLIVYSSDHGEMLGDHGMWGKTVPYQPSVSVPLVVAGQGVGKGLVCDLPVTLTDLPATFLECAGVPKPSDMDSISLKGLLEGKTREHRKCVVSGLGAWRMVCDGRYKLIKGFDPSRGKQKNDAALMLFDLKNDPLENNDLAGKEKDIVARMLQLLR